MRCPGFLKALVLVTSYGSGTVWSVCPFWLSGARPSQGAVRSFLVVLASSSSNLQLTLGLFASKCEGAGMRISPKAEAMVLSWNGGMPTLGWWWAVASSGRVQVPPGLFHKWGNQGVRIWQIDWCGICSKVDALMAVVVKRECWAWKQSCPFTSQSASSPSSVATSCGWWPKDWDQSIWALPTLVQRAYDTAFLGEVLWDVRLGGGTGVQPGHTGDIMSLGWFRYMHKVIQFFYYVCCSLELDSPSPLCSYGTASIHTLLMTLSDSY